MSYVNEIDIIIYESINEIYKDIKNEKLLKLKTFGKEDLYLKLIEKYINNNESKKKLKDIIKNKDQINKILDIIDKYIIIYCILYFGVKFKLEENIKNLEAEYVSNVLNITSSNKFKQLSSSINSTIINSFKFFNNLILLIDKNISDVQDELIIVKNFIDDIGSDIIRENFNKDNKDRSHNAILIIIFRNIYLKEDKFEIIKIFEEQNLKNADFKYITIVDSKFDLIDYSTIESLISVEDINSGLTKSLYELLVDYDNVDLYYVGSEKKINELFEKELLIPITDEFLRYHKDSEKYEKVEGMASTKIDLAERSNKKNDTKLKYIVTKINKLTDYYTPGSDRKEIEKVLYQPMLNRKVVLYNDTEEVSIISKFVNMGRVNLENSEFYSDLKQMRQSPYINFKNFANVGFQIKTNKYIDAIRYSNIEFFNNKNIIGSYNRPIEFRPLSKNIISNVIGIALPVTLFKNSQAIRCLSLKDFMDIRTINQNGFEACNELLKELLINVENKEKIAYWIFDVEKDKLLSDKYQNVNEINYESYLKTLLDNIYNKISILTYEILTNEINESSNNIYYLKKLINYIQDRFVQLNIREEYYSNIQKLLYHVKIPKVKNEYDKNEDKIPGVNSKLIKIPTIPKLKEKEIIIEIQEEETITKEDELLLNATCQHTITFGKIMMIRNKDPSLFDQALYEFIKKYKKDNVEGEFICKSCSQLLDIKKFIADTFQGGIFTLNLSTSTKPLEELSKYEKFNKAIKNIDKIIERVAYVMNNNIYVGNQPIVRLKRQELTKTIIDLIETTNESIRSNDPLIRKKNLELAEKNYGINKQYTNFFLFKLDNEIFVYTSNDTDKYKKYKYNNILAYIILLMILDMSNTQIFFLNFDKNYNYLLFNKFGYGLFNNLYIRVNNSNDVEPIKNYKILCYLIYYITGMMMKFNIWYFDQQIKDNKSFAKIGMEIIIQTVVHLLNTITEAFTNNRNNYLFDTISTRFFLKLNTQFNSNDSKEILDKIELQMSDKIDLTNNKIKIRSGTQHSTQQLEGKIESCSIPNKIFYSIDSLDTKERKKIFSKVKHEDVQDKVKKETKKILFEKYNIDGSKRSTVLKEDELNAYTDKDIEKLSLILRNRRNNLNIRFNKVLFIRNLKNEKKLTKEEKFIDKMNLGYKKYYDNNYDILVKKFIDKLESIIGENININNANIYLKENTYIIDHTYNGNNDQISVIKEAVYKPNHEYFKQNVLILNKDKVEIFYNAIENNLIGYREKGKNYVDVNGKGKFVKINYSIENKLKYLGFDNKYINVNDYQNDDIFTKEKYSNKHIIDIIMRNRINGLKKFMEFSQKIIYQIKNKKNIQIIEKGMTDIEKIKQKFSSTYKQDYQNKKELQITGDSEIVLNFQSKFKYINTTKDNNKKILINWTILNDSIFHNTEKTYNFKDKYIDASNLISLKDNDHIIIFYTLSELAYLIDLNDDSYTKSNLVFLIANIINYCYNLFNKQLSHVEFRKFKYMIESEAEVISYDVTTNLEFNQSEEEIKKQKELNDEDKEREEALDLDQDLKDEEVDDEMTDDEFTKFENRDE
uniref:Uncharacterized protein n=1 Tax=viral metagenome TaxID=1070528 RepID=A0A6C0H000_9ZZZZ